MAEPHGDKGLTENRPGLYRVGLKPIVERSLFLLLFCIVIKHQEGRRNAVSRWSNTSALPPCGSIKAYEQLLHQGLWLTRPCGTRIRLTLMTLPHQKVSKKLTHDKTSCDTCDGETTPPFLVFINNLFFIITFNAGHELRRARRMK